MSNESIVYLDTPLGVAILKGDEKGVSSIEVSDLKNYDHTIPTKEFPSCLLEAKKQLQQYFDGSRRTFEFAINPKGTAFQEKVWKELKTIPYSKTISYLDLAKRLGDPKVIRAAAAANGKNPLWIVVPCHRVIGSKGELTGYAGGVWRKKWLLDFENPVKQQTLF